MKVMKEIKTISEEVGVILKNVEIGRNHNLLTFENDQGMRMYQPISRGAKANKARDMANLRGQLKRFAKGMVHGLRIEK